MEIRTMDVIIRETVWIQRRVPWMEPWDTPTSRGHMENKKGTGK